MIMIMFKTFLYFAEMLICFSASPEQFVKVYIVYGMELKLNY